MSTLSTFISTLGFQMDGSFEKAMQTMAKRMSSVGSAMEASARKSLKGQANDASSYSALVNSLRGQELKAAEKAAYFDQKERNNKLKWLKQQQEEQSKLIKSASNLGILRQPPKQVQSLVTPPKPYDFKAQPIRQIIERIENHSINKKITTSETRKVVLKEDAHVYAFNEQQRKIEAAHVKALQENARIDRRNISRDNKIERDKAAAALKHQRVMQQENNRIAKAATLEMNKIHAEALKMDKQRTKEIENLKRGFSGGRGGSGFGMGGLGGIPIRGHTTLGMMAGGFGISEFTRQAYQMANYQAKTMPMLEFITNDKTKTPEQNKAAAASEKAYLDAEIKRLSLDRMSATKGYTQLAGDTYKSLGQQGTRDLFTSIQEVGLVTGRSADDMSRAIKAFSQMAGKKQIMS